MRAVVTLLLASLLPAMAAGSAPPSDVYAPLGIDLSDPDAVFQAMLEKGATELPAEALAAYEGGKAAAREGRREEAESLYELAAVLDPGFYEARLALAGLHFPYQPRAFGEDLVGAARAMRSSFGAQHLLLVNSIFAGILVLGATLLLLSAYLVLQLVPRFHHSLAEQMRRWLPSLLAGLLAGAVLLTPLLWRVGWLPLAAGAGGLFWFWMRRVERQVTIGVLILAAIVPLLLWLVSPVLYGPLDPAGKPFLLSRSMAATHSPGLVEAITTARAEDPRDPSLAFGLALVEKRGGHYKQARTLYEEARALGASPALVDNNLGVIAFLEGDYDEALARLQESVAEDDERAASHFNLSQTYAKKLYFEKADQELLKANRLALNRIRATLRHSEGDDKRTMIDEPLPPSLLWKAAWKMPRAMPGLPSQLRPFFPGSLWLLPLLSLVLFAGGWVGGRRLHQVLPSFPCTNCRRPVCRRCLRRIRRQAYCTSCGDALLRIQSSSYSRLVLDSRIRRNRRLYSILSQIGSWTLPGLYAASRGRTVLSWCITLLFAAGLLGLVHRTLPVTRLAWLDGSAGPWWPHVPLVLMGIAVVASWVAVVRIPAAAVGTALKPEEEEEPTGDPGPEGVRAA